MTKTTTKTKTKTTGKTTTDTTKVQQKILSQRGTQIQPLRQQNKK